MPVGAIAYMLFKKMHILWEGYAFFLSVTKIYPWILWKAIPLFFYEFSVFYI